MSQDSSCKLCGIPCKRHSTNRAFVELYECEACGAYETADQDGKAAPYSLPEEKKFLISAFVRSHCERTGRPYLFSDRTPGKSFPLDLPELTVSERINRALLLVADRSKWLGATVRVDSRTDWPLLGATGPAELKYILKHLKAVGQLTDESDIKAYPAFATLSALGWREADRLRPGRIRSRQAFVAMAFDPALDSAYALGIEPALKESGYSPWRSDRDHYLEKIDDRIIAEIRRSGLLIADATMHKHGVYFEAGFALGLSLPVVWTCREDDIKNAHFDTRQYPHILWSEPPDLRSKLRDRIQALFPRSAE